MQSDSKKSAPRAWVRQPSGKRLNLIEPAFSDWDDEDLAIGLSRAFRWGGHSAWPWPLSVAQHSLLVLQIMHDYAGDTLEPDIALRELLHDAEEGLIGFDPISPLKPILGPAFAAVMDNLRRAVFARYGVRTWTPTEHKQHKMADTLAAASEAVHVAGWPVEEVRRTLGITQKPLVDDPLVRVFGGTPWEPWPSDLAARRFCETLRALARGV